MVVTTSEQIDSLIKKLRQDFLTQSASDSNTELKFHDGEIFSWNHATNTICYDSTQENAPVYLLHEFCHLLLKHKNYEREIELIAMERDAWEKTVEIAERYNIIVPKDTIEDAMNSYRDWLHARSVCPKCQATGLQFEKLAYRCLACQNEWFVNEAKTCALRRYNKIPRA